MVAQRGSRSASACAPGLQRGAHVGKVYRDSGRIVTAIPIPQRIKCLVLRPDRPLFALFQSVGTQALITVINILTGVISARMLGPDGRGIFAAVSTWPQFFATLAMAGLNSAVVYHMKKTPEHGSEIAGAALTLCLAASGIAVAVGAALVPQL